jgi:exonuclease VII large subunit
MNPTPSPTPSNGVAILMAEIERIAQELRAVNKRPLPATEEQVKALLTLAERERPLTLNVNSQAVATLLLGQVDQQAQRLQTGANKLIKLVDDRTDYLVEQLTARLAAVQAAEASLAAAVQRIPRSVPLNVFENWRSTLGFTLGPVVLVLLGMLFAGHFSRVPKAELEQARAELAQAQGVVGRFRELRAELAQERPELAYRYFPYPNDPKPVTPKKAR